MYVYFIYFFLITLNFVFYNDILRRKFRFSEENILVKFLSGYNVNIS